MKVIRPALYRRGYFNGERFDEESLRRRHLLILAG
jgi:hypothetical protein